MQAPKGEHSEPDKAAIPLSFPVAMPYGHVAWDTSARHLGKAHVAKVTMELLQKSP